MKNKNIVLITIDALRASDVGCIGGGNLTPNIDKLAQKSVLFKEAISNGPGTPQSFPSIFASVYPLMNRKILLSKRYVTLAQVLRDNGFVTMGFHSNPFLSKFFGWDKGFDIFIDLSDSSSATRMFKKLTQKEGLIGFMLKPVKKILTKRTIRKILKRIYSVKSDSPLPYSRGEDVNRTVIKWLKEKKKGRFFLWIHYMDPHEPYLPPDPWLDSVSSQKEALEINLRFCTENVSGDQLELIEKAKKLYDGEVKYVDHCVGNLVDVFVEWGLLEDTIIVLTADHGEAFFEHGERGHPDHILYEEVLRVPLIIYGVGEKKEVTEPVQLLDISPTILSLLGIDKPSTFLGNGLGLNYETGVISESARFNFDNYAFDLNKRVISYRTEKWKLIFNQEGNVYELYNFDKDPKEQRNVARENKELVEVLKEKITQHIKRSSSY